MAAQIVRGFPITLDAFFADNEGNPVNPVDPRADIIDANGTTIIDNDVPTNVALGHYQYTYPTASDALLGAWAIRWTGTINGFAVSDEDGFTVVLPGSISTPGSGDGQTCQPWATHEDAIGDCADYAVDTDELDLNMQIATDILWNLTGRRWSGVCTDRVRPQAQWRRDDGPRAWWPADGRGTWGWCSCHRGRETGCSRIPEIRLPSGPVDPSSVVVKIDGAVLNPETYRIDDSRYLVRVDGDGWPCCQALTLEDSEDSTFSVAYAYGRLPPVGGVRAAALYGCQLLLASSPDSAGRCMLPKGVVQLIRAGTTTRFSDPLSLVDRGMVGLPSVDGWVRSVLEGDKRRRATVMTPGKARAFRRTT